MDENKVDEIKNEFKEMLKQSIAQLETTKLGEGKRTANSIRALMRELELKMKIIRLDLKILKYKEK